MASNSYLKNAPLKDKMPGSWDVEVCHEGEADLYRHHKCTKNPGHKEFIPVDTFNITHLPMDYQDRDIEEYIKLVAQLTVRLTVRYVSPNRPATVPCTDTPYPSYENRGKNVMRVGTGMITDVQGNNITIKTATHVVFDNDEAKSTSCDFFFDNGNLPAVCDTAIEVKCSDSLIKTNTIVDECFVWIYLSNNVQVVDKITSFFSKMLELRTKIINRLSESSNDRQNQYLTFIVSHPHGCSKKISIGRCVEVDDNLDDVRFLYTTPTCPGSSGAAVTCLDKLAWNLHSTHSGTWKNDASLNLGSGSYLPIEYTIPLDCKYYPQYEDRRFPDSGPSVLYTLPHELNYNLVYDYINMWCYLYAYIDVNYVSEQRPEFWPGSELPYPWYKKRGRRKWRRGRGWVDRVDIYPSELAPGKTCDCDLCRNSSTPETNFAHVYILTSNSLVFDQTEGKNTTCGDLYGKLDSFCGTHPLSSDVETDRCQLVFMTHNLDHAKRLKMFLERVSFFKEKIQDKLSPHLSANPVSIKINYYLNNKIGRFVRVDKHLVYTNKGRQDDVGDPIILLGSKDLHVDVSAHTGQYPLDPKYGYSRHLDYQYKSTQLKDLLTD